LQKQFVYKNTIYSNSVYQDFSAMTKHPHPRPLSHKERGDKRLPRPLGEGWGEGAKF